MSVRLRDLLLLTAFALAARLAVALLIPDPPWTDSAYYYASAREMVTGGGLTVPFVWSFLETGGTLPTDPELPIPSHAHWMPLTSFVAAAFMSVFGPHWWAGQLPMVGLSTILSPLTYLAAMKLWRSRTAAIGGAVLVVFCGPLLLFGSIVENFAVFGLVGFGALLAAMRAARGGSRAGWWLVGSGALVGVATLARIDGVLLSVATATAWLIGMRITPWRWEGPRIGWMPGFASFAAFSAVVAPWAIRNILTFGAALPSTGGHTLWIKSYNEQFSLTADTTISAFLAQGPIAIFASKVEGWAVSAGYVIVLLGVFGLLLIGSFIARRRSPALAPFAAYFAFMLFVMGGIFTFHAPRGLFIHHAAAWLPIAAPLGILGIQPSASALSRWWRFLGRAQTQRFLLIASLAASVLISMITSTTMRGVWHEDVTAMKRAGDFLALSAHPDDVVIHRNAPLLNAITGFQAVAAPHDPFPIMEQVVRTYGGRWFVVQVQSSGPRIEPLGLWEGGRSVDAQGNRADWLADEPSFETANLRIYKVRAP